MAELDVCGQAMLQKDKQFQEGLTQLCLPFLISSLTYLKFLFHEPGSENCKQLTVNKLTKNNKKISRN